MQLIVETKENLKYYARLEKNLKKALGKHKIHTWSFPNGGRKVELRTYQGPRHLTVGVDSWPNEDSKPKMLSGFPILIKTGPFEGNITPTVEANIPIKKIKNPISRNGRVNGCFARDENGKIWLCHRGIRLTVGRNKIPKNEIHHHFRKWLAPFVDINHKNRPFIKNRLFQLPL